MENWKRPQQEIDALMTLCLTYLDGEREAMVREGMRFKVIGRRAELPREVVAAIESVGTGDGCEHRAALVPGDQLWVAGGDH
jgi:undecaprenyl diphosphate synthase